MVAADAPYAWLDGWGAQLGDDPSVADGWSHTGVAVTRDGNLLVGASRDPTILVLDREGVVVQRMPTSGLVELHAFAVVEDGGEDRIWIADTGAKDRAIGPDVDWTPSPAGGSVVQVDLAGRTVGVLPRPEFAAYGDSLYQPTSVVVDEPRLGGSGDVWVADGYGASLVHRYGADGRYLASLTGEEGAGRFACPHALLVDRRGREPELYVADRGNRRIQVFDLGGRYRRSFGEDVLAGPSDMAVVDGLLAVTDLMGGRVTRFAPDGRAVDHLFANSEAPGRGDWPDGWPNVRGDDGDIVRPGLRAGVFNSPHGITADADANLYVSEWVLGARFVKLAARAGR